MCDEAQASADAKLIWQNLTASTRVTQADLLIQHLFLMCLMALIGARVQIHPAFLLQGPPHKCALFFVDNSGVDIILGVMPFVRELLSRGTEVRNTV